MNPLCLGFLFVGNTHMEADHPTTPPGQTAKTAAYFAKDIAVASTNKCTSATRLATEID